MNAAIVDDEPDFLIQISDLLQDIANEQNFCIKSECFLSSEKFLEKYIPDKYDVLFLDIDMPEINGFELTELLRGKNDNVHIVYITNRDDLIIHAFRYKVLGFVRKNHIKDELPYAVSTIMSEIKKAERTIILTETRANGGNVKTVLIDNIFYIESHNHNAYVHFSDGKQLVVRKSLTDFLNISGFENFTYINSGTIVNMSEAKIEGATVVFPDNITLYISRRRMKDVRNAYLKSLRRILI